MPFLDNSLHLARVWLAIVRVSIIREMEFRANFILGLVRQIAWLGIFILMIKTVFANTTSLAGWGQNEVLIILSLSRIIEGFLNTVFSRNVAEVPQMIQAGTFDFILTKPMPAQLYASFRRFKVDSLANVVAGIVLLIYALTQLPTLPSISSLLIFMLVSLLGIAVFYSLLIIVVSLAFLLERFEGFYAFTNMFSEPLTVPFDIFPRGPRLILTYLLPLAFVVFVPAQALTHRLQGWQVIVSIVITSIFLLLAHLAWRSGIRRYSSASS